MTSSKLFPTLKQGNCGRVVLFDRWASVRGRAVIQPLALQPCLQVVCYFHIIQVHEGEMRIALYAYVIPAGGSFKLCLCPTLGVMAS